MVEIPSNTTATVHLPASKASQVKEGHMALKEAMGIRQINEVNGELQLVLGSGTYEFVVIR